MELVYTSSTMLNKENAKSMLQEIPVPENLEFWQLTCTQFTCRTSIAVYLFTSNRPVCRCNHEAFTPLGPSLCRAFPFLSCS